jgi:hypothetical protein
MPGEDLTDRAAHLESVLEARHLSLPREPESA